MAKTAKILAGAAIACVALAVTLNLAGTRAKHPDLQMWACALQGLSVGLLAGAVLAMGAQPEKFGADQCIPVPVFQAVDNYGTDIRFGCGDENCKIILPGSPHVGKKYPSDIQGCLACTSECPNAS